MALSIESFEKVIKEDQAKRRVAHIEDVSFDSSVVAPGENFTASLLRANLNIQLGNGKKTKTSYVIKEKPVEGPRNDFFESHELALTEVKVYDEILPLVEEVLLEQGMPPLWPKLIGEIDNYLVITDLKSKNYRTVKKNERLDLYHSLLVLRTLAIFHAANIALKHRGLVNESTIPLTTIHLRDKPDMRKMNETCLELLSEVIIEEWGPKWRDIGERLQKKSTTFYDDLRKMVVVDESRLNLLCHGDLWSSNLMFKYSRGTDVPIGVRFIDFQLSHYNSYGYDLLYFLGTSVQLELRREKRRLLLETYSNVLRESLELYGLGDVAPSLSDVEAELERLKNYDIFVLLGVMPVVTATVETPFTIADFGGKNGPYNPDIFRRDNYKEEIEQELLQWAEQGFI